MKKQLSKGVLRKTCSENMQQRNLIVTNQIDYVEI